jgi:hypothetical protein
MFTNFSEVIAASIIRASATLHGATTQKTAIFNINRVHGYPTADFSQAGLISDL